ncbi:MAG: C25 family cysteine peptidase, partial [Ignavibacteriaceae bacterium]
MKYFYCLFSTFFSFLILVNFALAKTPDGIDLKKTSNGYQLEFSLPDYQLNSVNAEGEEYFRITVPDYGTTPEVGLPALPLISFNLFVAFREEAPEFAIKNVQTEELAITKKIYPFQMPWEKLYPLGERPFTINKNYYNSTGNLNQPLVQISEPFIIAGVKGVMITIYPFKYNPSENKLLITRKASVDINLSYPVQPVTDKSEVYNEFFKNIFVNYEGVVSRSNMKYLVITAPAFETDMQSFVSHKISKGFDVDMFNTTATGTTKEAINSFIQQRYNEPSTKPDFVLLVGDVAQIPAWTGSGAGSPTTDLNYAQLEGGDYFADVFIGRFSVTTSTQLQNAINKSVYMEDYIGTLAKKNVFM